jgi:hypothetical protein
LEQNIDKDTPESIDWWVNIEKKYSRDLVAEDRNITKDNTKFVGFYSIAVFKASSYSFMCGISVLSILSI